MVRLSERLRPSPTIMNDDIPRKCTPTSGYTFPSTVSFADNSMSVPLNADISFSQSSFSNSKKNVRSVPTSYSAAPG